MISISGVRKNFGEQRVLNDINIEIEKGDIVGVIGISGAGKSTLLRCIGGLETPTEGTIKVDGQELGTLKNKERLSYFKGVGTVFQGYNLMMQKTVAKNIALPLEISKMPKSQINARVAELLELVGLEEKANVYPSTLSGGQKQRVTIARALANNPKLLLCDEPTSALDCLTTRSILNLLKSINQELGITIIIITHDIDVVESICNKVVVLDQSELVEQGNTLDIFENPKAVITRRFLGEE